MEKPYKLWDELKKRYHLVFLLLLFVFHLVCNLVIVHNDTTPLLWDGGDYFYRSLRYYDVLRAPGPGFFRNFLAVSTYRPPLFMLTSLPLYLVFGRSPDTAVGTNLIYLFIMIFAVFGIGRRLHSTKAGLLGSFLVSIFPLLFGLGRNYWLDFPLTAMVALSLYLLIRTDQFRDRKFSILFGVSFGLGMLVKWSYFVFCAGPFLYTLIAALAGRGKQENADAAPRRRPVMANAAFALLVAAAVAAFWYVPNGLNVAGKLLGLSVGSTGEEATRFELLGETIGPSKILSPSSLLYYAGKLANEQIGFVFALLLLGCTVWLLIRKKAQGNFWFLLLWILVPVIGFTLIKNKTGRNTVPMLPAAALLISMGIMEIRDTRARNAFTLFVVLFGMLQYSVSSFGSRILPKKLSIDSRLGSLILFQQPPNASYATYRSSTGNWKAEEILNAIEASRGSSRQVSIVLLPRDAFTWMAMEYSAYLKGLPYDFIGAVDTPEAVLRADYLLLKKGGFVAPWFSMKNLHNAFDLLEQNQDDFVLLRTMTLPECMDFLSIYDIEAPRGTISSGVVFSDRLKLLDYTVTDTREGDSRRFVFSARVEVLRTFEEKPVPVFRLLDKKLEVLGTERGQQEPSEPAWAAGEVRVLDSTFQIPIGNSEEFFWMELGFYEPKTKALLPFCSEYLIYKRKVT